jgi:hypothetical protein
LQSVTKSHTFATDNSHRDELSGKAWHDCLYGIRTVFFPLPTAANSRFFFAPTQEMRQRTHHATSGGEHSIFLPIHYSYAFYPQKW